MSDELTAIEAPLEALVRELCGSRAPLPWEDDLLAVGFVGSIHMLEILVFMEERFGIEVDPFDIKPECFRTINTMARFVRDKLGGLGHS